MIEDNDLKQFLEPRLLEWNRLTPDNLRALRAAPLSIGGDGPVTYITEKRTLEFDG